MASVMSTTTSCRYVQGVVCRRAEEIANGVLRFRERLTKETQQLSASLSHPHLLAIKYSPGQIEKGNNHSLTPSLLGYIFAMSFECDQMILLTL